MNVNVNVKAHQAATDSAAAAIVHQQLGVLGLQL